MMFKRWVLRLRTHNGCCHRDSLSQTRFSSWGYLIGGAALLLVAQGSFLSSKLYPSAWIGSGELALWLCFTPALVIALLDFRAALLLSIVSTPLFSAPPIPHLMTQGFGDLFALAAVIGFLLSCWRRAVNLVDGVNAILLLLPGAALASIFYNSTVQDLIFWSQIKYQIAELAGLLLSVSYTLLLASSIQSEKDLRVFLSATLVAVCMSMVQAVVSLGLVSACVNDLHGTIMSPGGQLSAGFGNPNYYGSWLLVVLLTLMLRIPTQQTGAAIKGLLCVIPILVILTVSRSALLALGVVLFVGVCICDQWRSKFKLSAFLLTLVILFPAGWDFRFQACRTDDAQPLMDYVYQANSISFAASGLIFNYLNGKTIEPLQEGKTIEQLQEGKTIEQLQEGMTIGPLSVEQEFYRPSRMQLLTFAKEAWQSSPLLGIGPGRLSNLINDQTGSREGAHNVMATMLAEQGLIGALVWLLLWFGLLWKIIGTGPGLRDPRYRKYLLLAFISLTITSLFSDQYRVIWLWQFVALVISPYFSTDNYPPQAIAHEKCSLSIK